MGSFIIVVLVLFILLVIILLGSCKESTTEFPLITTSPGLVGSL
ncbi:hypothetical protein WAK64_10860 [Bacillus spongiae]|uniref:YjcZ family sporulation protein n=1 Tax=Bacillus spongiae TaxID=2683610 RepID=A0ABU8HEH5_9BACI